MANNKSSEKDIRRTAKRTEANRMAKSRLKTLSRASKESKDVESLKVNASKLVAAMDKAVKTNKVHKNKANKVKSNLAKAINKMAAA
ncbi:MAG: 30S ribosomal protein S20 [Opitutales bacterium]